MAATPSLYQISYRTLSFPGTVGNSRVELHGVHELEISYRAFTVSFSVIIHNQTEADFISDMATLESTLDTPRGNTTITLPGGTVHSFSFDSNTALNPEASYVKPGSPVDTARSRLYVITIAGGKPADLSGQSGLRDFSWRYDDDQNLETLTVSGQYTAIGGTQARDQYLASIASRISTIETALGGTWELLSDSHEPDDTDQVVNFRRRKKRVTVSQTASALDSAALFNQSLKIDRQRRSAGEKEGTPLVRVSVRYRASVVRSEVDDTGVVQASQMLSLWEDTVRPHLVNAAESFTDGTTAVVFEAAGISMDPPGFESALELVAKDGGETLLSRRLVTSDRVDGGAVITRFWPRRRGSQVDRRTQDPTPAVDNQGPRRIERTVEEVRTSVGTADVAPLGGGSLRDEIEDPEGEGGNVSLIRWETRFREYVDRVGSGTGITKTDQITVATWELLGELRGG